ncbi:MAG: N-6 DNA methylase [Candidatus Helarchaeota archaeon]
MVIVEVKKKRRTYGEHLTPIEIFRRFILPEIKDQIYKYKWVDMFAGEGNLILPILELVPRSKRVEFFRNHLFLFEIQDNLIKKAVSNAIRYGIPKEIAMKNIIHKDTLNSYPRNILDDEYPIYHITNPPYLYIGYIKKHDETKRYLQLFEGKNEGYQDLYQIALINDLRNGLKKMIYIIPSNFLFGASGSNKIRRDFLEYYNINKIYILEKDIFEYTGVNVIIAFFERKKVPRLDPISFKGIKIAKKEIEKSYILRPENNYRAGNQFEVFTREYKAVPSLKVKYYLLLEEVEANKGNNKIEVIDSNAYTGSEYEKLVINVNDYLYNKIKSNVLFVRTIDTGLMNGRAGLYMIKEVFGVDGILVTKAKYRTHPIQVFITPDLMLEDQILLKNYFNLLLEHFRALTDSEFMTTYKYSNSDYIRKYLGLSQTRKLIETFPIADIENSREIIRDMVLNKKVDELIKYIKKNNRKRRTKTLFEVN